MKFVGIAFACALVSLACHPASPTSVRPREQVLRTELQILRTAVRCYCEERGRCPGSLGELVTEGYLRELFEDPFTVSTDSWVVVRNGRGEVVDVRSGSPERASDGTLLASW